MDRSGPGCGRSATAISGTDRGGEFARGASGIAQEPAGVVAGDRAAAGGFEDREAAEREAGRRSGRAGCTGTAAARTAYHRRSFATRLHARRQAGGRDQPPTREVMHQNERQRAVAVIIFTDKQAVLV